MNKAMEGQRATHNIVKRETQFALIFLKLRDINVCPDSIWGIYYIVYTVTSLNVMYQSKLSKIMNITDIFALY